MIKHHQLPAHISFSQDLTNIINQSLSPATTYSLSNSCGQSLTLEQLCELAGAEFTQRFKELPLSYASLRGSSELRQAIINFHHQLNPMRAVDSYATTNSVESATHLTEENVLTFCGAQEALAAVYQSLLSAGDEIVVFTPCYPSLVTMAERLGVTVNAITLSSNNGWQLNFEELKQKVNEKTRLIVINSPHNPSGNVVDTDLADKILELAQKYQCYLLADDVSQASNYHNLPLAHHYLSYSKAIVVSVLSKSFGLAGVRIGWATSHDEALMEQLLAVKCYGSICCSATDELLAIAALNHHQELIERNNKIIVDNISHFQNFIDKNSTILSWLPPKAGLLAVVHSHLNTPIMQWSKTLAKEEGVLLLPTELFGLKAEAFRLGLGQKDFPKALAGLQRFINCHYSI
jgi:aspartate/methionine/tyrosine aminotransferase